MSERYTPGAIALHWIVAALILFNLGFGLYTVGLPLSPQKLRFFSFHKWIGVTIFLLAAARLLWRLSHPAPPLPAAMPAWEKAAARATHALLYALFFAAPLTGWLSSSASGFQTVYLGLFPIPDLLVYISAAITLDPGDLVLTGSPAGTGPLVAGDVVEVEIAGVGVLSNPVRAEAA